jgi:predicted nucleotide-binding protein/nucleoside phosphorylase
LTEVQGKVDFGIITVREDEFEAVLARFPSTGRVSGRRHYNLCQVDLPGGGSYLGAVLRCIEQGNGEAQSAAHDLLEELKPQWLFVVGIAGGVPSDEFCLGDVIVSTRIHDFSVEAVLHESKPEYALGGGPVERNGAVLVANIPALRTELGGWNATAAIAEPRPELKLREAAFYGGMEWSDRVRKALSHHVGRMVPRVLSGAIASSDRLIKDTEILAVWTKMARQVLAAEMESAGVYRATYGRQVPALSIRGISDIVGLKREPEWTRYACHTAAAFALALVRTRPFEPRNQSTEAVHPEPGQPLKAASTRPRVFIGTSMAGVGVAEVIQLGLDAHAECTIKEQAVGGLTGASLENLARTARSVDFAVLVLTPEDLFHGSNARHSPRDAVLMELGFFVGALGRERTCLVYSRDELAELPAGLVGVSAATYGRRADGNTQAALGPVCTQIKMALERLKNVRELGSGASGDAAIQRLSSELMSLRTEFSEQTEHVRRMMELLTAEREPSPKRSDAFRLRAMEGAWYDPYSESWGYARFLGGELRFAYCFGGNFQLSAEHYNWHFVGSALCARFRWFDNAIEGYVYFEEVGTNRMRGGWWMSRDVPEHLIGELPRVRGMNDMEWVRQEGAAIPDWAEAFFEKIEEMLRAR